MTAVGERRAGLRCLPGVFWLVALHWASSWHVVEAARVGFFPNLPPSHPLAGLDLETARFDEEGIIFPNGSRWNPPKNEDGFPVWTEEGQKRMDPFEGIDVEDVLPTDSLVCHENKLVAVRLPLQLPQGRKIRRRRAKSLRKFYYVKRKPMPNLEPIEIYNDLADDARHFLLCPPTNEFGKTYDWRLLMRRAISLRKNTGWSEQRMFGIARSSFENHPCAPLESSSEEEEGEPGQEVDAAKVGSEANATEEVVHPEEPQVEKPVARAYVAYDEDYDVPRGAGRSIFAASSKPGVVAEDALRFLVSKWWKPADWPEVVVEVPEVAD